MAVGVLAFSFPFLRRGGSAVGDRGVGVAAVARSGCVNHKPELSDLLPGRLHKRCSVNSGVGMAE